MYLSASNNFRKRFVLFMGSRFWRLADFTQQQRICLQYSGPHTILQMFYFQSHSRQTAALRPRRASQVTLGRTADSF